MNVVYFLLLVLAAVCFAASAFGDRATDSPTLTRGRLRFLALGLLFWVLVPLIQHLRAL